MVIILITGNLRLYVQHWVKRSQMFWHQKELNCYKRGQPPSWWTSLCVWMFAVVNVAVELWKESTRKEQSWPSVRARQQPLRRRFVPSTRW